MQWLLFTDLSKHATTCNEGVHVLGAAPEGGSARIPAGTHPHLLVVGVGSPIAVPCRARLGAIGEVKANSRRGECDHRDL
jgi:hypothetical protein